MHFKKLAVSTFVSLPLLSPVSSVLADDLLEIVITPNRFPAKMENSFQPVTVIDREEIENKQPHSTLDLLKQIPGVDVQSQGGIGQNTEIMLRGNKTAHTLVLVDGIRIGSNTLGKASIETIPPEIIERIEVIRGPRSALYGGDAIGGVIQIFTRRKQGPAQASVEAGAGTHDTQKENIAITGGNKNTSAGFVVSNYQTEGFNVTNPKSYSYNPDKDGYDNTSTALNVHHRLSNSTNAFFTVLNAEGRSDYDSGLDYSTGAYPTDFSDYTQFVANAGLSSSLSKKFHLNAVAGESHDYTTNYGGSPGYFKSRKQNLNVNGNYTFNPGTDLLAGVEVLNDTIASSSDFEIGNRRTSALYLQQTITQGQHSVMLGGRRENIQRYGKHNTSNIAYSYALAQDSKITASIGQGFKVPTFNDLYWPNDGYSFGNPNLLPETSSSREIDFIKCFQNGHIGASIFRTMYHDLIQWTEIAPGVYQPTNIGRADISGIELEGHARFGAWDTYATLAYLRPINKDFDEDFDLMRRARRGGSLSADYSMQAWKFGASVSAQGARFDDDANFDRVGGYGTTDLHALWSVTKNLDVKFAVFNAGDKAYQSVRGYNAADREFLTSIKLNF